MSRRKAQPNEVQVEATPTTKPAGRSGRLVWLTEAQAALGWGVILILVALLGAIYLNQASKIAGIGRRVQQLQFELDTLKRQNATLERSIAEAESLERLDREAARLGFVRASPDDIEYLIVPDYPVSSSLAAPVEVVSPPQPVATLREALWLALKASVGDPVRGESP